MNCPSVYGASRAFDITPSSKGQHHARTDSQVRNRTAAAAGTDSRAVERPHGETASGTQPPRRVVRLRPSAETGLRVKPSCVESWRSTTRCRHCVRLRRRRNACLGYVKTSACGYSTHSWTPRFCDATSAGSIGGTVAGRRSRNHAAGFTNGPTQAQVVAAWNTRDSGREEGVGR